MIITPCISLQSHRTIPFLSNSMQQENINRSLTNNQYVQTRLNQSYVYNQPGMHNYVPFLIKSNRFASHSNNISAPPIGTYNLPSCFDRKKSPFEDRISHFILQSQKKNDQMCIFKSSLTRFQKVKNHSPGPASYNLFNNSPDTRKINTKENSDKENLIDLSRTCPSIPNKSNKYGYAIVNGQMKNIEKTDQQLEQERQSRKHYVETLNGQNTLYREVSHQDYHDTDQKRKLYQKTSKFFNKKNEMDLNSKSDINLLRKPKYEHLHHSKPVQISNQHKYLGPGQYEVCKSISPPTKKEKFQFFGSTEVRFKEKSQLPEKGYSLLEMIKESHALDGLTKQKKSPLKNKSREKTEPLDDQSSFRKSPGPGQYNPKDDCFKKNRRNVFFPAEQRFKDQPLNDQDVEPEELAPEFSKSRLKKGYNPSSLKKERFKPMHQNYEPVKSSQICGILSENTDPIAKQRKSNKKYFGKILKLNSKRGTEGDQQIKSWSRDQSRKKGGYMRYLKQELALITYSPAPEESSKKQTKKFQRKQGQ